MYYFFLNDQLLPVPPPKLELKINNNNKTINLINEGEVNIIKTPGLTEISFEILLPNQFYPFAFYDNNRSNFINRLSGYRPAIVYAKDYIAGFERMKTANKPLRLIISRFSQNLQYISDTNIEVTLEEYSVNESTEYGFDWQVPLQFKQYRHYATKELEVTTTAEGEAVATIKQTRPTTREIPQTYKVTSDTNMWELCRRAAGGSLDWRAVAELNGTLDPNNVVRGTILTLR